MRNKWVLLFIIENQELLKKFSLILSQLNRDLLGKIVQERLPDRHNYDSDLTHYQKILLIVGQNESFF